MIDQLTDFVREQSAAAGPRERLPGSTEWLESLIGKGKRLVGQQSRSAFAPMILGIAASVVKSVRHVIQAALVTVKTRDVDEWAQEKLGPSVQARPRLAFSKAAGGTKPGQKNAPLSNQFLSVHATHHALALLQKSISPTHATGRDTRSRSGKPGCPLSEISAKKMLDSS